MNISRFARYYFFATAALVLAGIIIELFVSAGRETSYFDTPFARVLNFFTYFTVLSNLLVGGTSYLLATKQHLTSSVFWGFRLSGLIAIVITFLVQHLVIAPNKETPTGLPFMSDFILHTAVPILAFVGWLLFGPRSFITNKIIALSTIFPIAWLVFVFIRGAITGWYPYDFLNVTEHGYAKALLYVGAITVGFICFAFAAKLYDAITRRARR